MVRRPAAVAAAVVLAVEACGAVLVTWVLGLTVDEQQMSLAGLEPRAMAVSAWAAGLVLAGYLVLCGALLLRAALLDHTPAGFGRVLLVSCAVLHGLLGAVAVGLVGWLAFAALVLSLALQVLVLVGEDEAPRGDGTPDGAADPDGPEGRDAVTPTAG